MKVTKCPPDEAIGARDLQHWASRRIAGWSGSGRWFDDDDARRRPGDDDGRSWSPWVEVSPPSCAGAGAMMFERYSIEMRE
jgi:hypothetical protein